MNDTEQILRKILDEINQARPNPDNQLMPKTEYVKGFSMGLSYAAAKVQKYIHDEATAQGAGVTDK